MRFVELAVLLQEVMWYSYTLQQFKENQSSWCKIAIEEPDVPRGIAFGSRSHSCTDIGPSRSMLMSSQSRSHLVIPRAKANASITTRNTLSRTTKSASTNLGNERWSRNSLIAVRFGSLRVRFVRLLSSIQPLQACYKASERIW